jgi:hypothetical protein
MEHEMSKLITMRILFTTWLFLFITTISGESGLAEFSLYLPDNPDSSVINQNELTIYVIPSKCKYDWTSPHSLKKSYFRNYKRNFFKKEKYLLGHTFIELQSSLIPGSIFAGMRVASGKEQRDLVFKQNYGLAILGADMEGQLETITDLEPKVEKYSRKGQLAYMTIIISDAAAERMIGFFNAYKAGIEGIGSPGARYSGVFWRRYEGEGSGCSAFVVSFLDLAGLLVEEFDEWLVKVDIPMDLIGGPYNNYNDVRLRDIKKHKSWDAGYESDTVAFEHIEIYDPTLMYEWIQNIWEKPETLENLEVTPLKLNESKGIRMDGRNFPLPEEEKIFMERKNPSLFIDYYNKK